MGQRSRVVIGIASAALAGAIALSGLVTAAPAVAKPSYAATCWRAGCHSRPVTSIALSTSYVSGHRMRVTSNARSVAVYLGTVKKATKTGTAARAFTFQGVAGKTYTVVAVSRVGQSRRTARRL